MSSKNLKLALLGTLALTLGAGLVTVVPAVHADSSPTANASTTNPQLQTGLDQYAAGQFEAAVSSLSQVDPKTLSFSDQARWSEALTIAKEAVRQRRVALNELTAGDQALAQGKPSDAIPHYKAVLSNLYVDSDMLHQATVDLNLAQEKLGIQPTNPLQAQTPQGWTGSTSTPDASVQAPVLLASAAPASATATPASGDSLYFQAVDDMNAGRYDQARQEFQQLMSDNYVPPVFHRTPKEMLVEIEARTGQPSFPNETPAAAPAPQKLQDTTAPPQPASPPPSSSGHAAPENPPPPGASPADTTPPPQPTPPSPGEPLPAPAITPAPAVVPPSTVTPAPGPSASEQLQNEAANQKQAEDQSKFRARGLVDLARQAYADGDRAEALKDYSLAVNLDPDNKDAQDGKAQCEAELGNGAPAPVASQFRQQIEIEIQDINFRFSTAIRDARAAIAADDFATAERRLEDARVARSIDPGIFPIEQIREMDATIAQVDQQMKDEKAAFDLRTASATQQEIQQEQEARAAQQREERDKTVASLIRVCRQDIDANNYAGALGVLDQIQILDPNNDYALGVRQFVEDRAVLQDQAHWRELFDRNLAKVMAEGDEQQIPYDDIVRYPENWPDISQERGAEVQEERGVSREDEVTQALLDKELPEMSFDGTTLADAIDYFHDITGANILLDTKALEAAGVDRSTPITLKLNNVKFSKALDTVLKLVGGTVPLGYDIDQNVITISTEDELNKKTELAVYDIHDLLVQVPMFMASDASSVTSSISSGGGSQQLGGASGGATSIGNNGGGNIGNIGNTNNNQQNSQQSLDALIKLITDTVAPDSWRNGTAGGTVGSIEPLMGTGQIVVTQTAENQQKVIDLLDKIREKRDIMITVEVRFLSVARDFLDNVGLNLSATFNLNRSSNSVFSTIPVANILSSGFTGTPTVAGAAVDLASLTTPTSIALTYLDDFEVNFMLQAVEASANTSVVTAPRVTVFNGGSALLSNVHSTYYVQSLVPTLAAGAVGFTPTVAQATGGATLFIQQAVVSADRKYVTLQLSPLLQSPPTLTSFTFATGVIATGGVTGGTSGTFNETVQLPSQQVTFVETVVTVPDGGTLLLGGETIAGETELEQGLPVLSQVPFLKRLFTNESMAKDNQVLFIMVKPTILIQREQEEKAFPLLTNQAPVGE